MILQPICDDQLIVDDHALRYAPYGQLSITIGSDQCAYWRGLPIAWNGTHVGYDSGILIQSKLSDDNCRMTESRIILTKEQESNDMLQQIIGIEDPTHDELAMGVPAIFYTQVFLKENPTPDRWADTNLAYRLLNKAGLSKPTVFLSSQEISEAFGRHCGMVKEAEPISIRGKSFILFEYGCKRQSTYIDKFGRRRSSCSNIAYCQINGKNIRTLLNAETDGVQDYSTAGKQFIGPDGEHYLAFNRKQNEIFSVWLGKLSLEDGSLVLTPLMELIEGPHTEQGGYGPGKQLISFASCVLYDESKRLLSVFYHVNDAILRKRTILLS